MALLDDILKALDRWDLWRQITTTPERVESLERRVAELETKLGETWPPDVCTACGKRALRHSFDRGPDANGVVTQYWTCQSCDSEQRRPIKAH